MTVISIVCMFVVVQIWYKSCLLHSVIVTTQHSRNCRETLHKKHPNKTVHEKAGQQIWPRRHMALLASLCDAAGKTSGWTVTTQVKNGKIAEHAEDFDFVVLATGSFLIPRIPDIKVHTQTEGKHKITDNIQRKFTSN